MLNFLDALTASFNPFLERAPICNQFYRYKFAKREISNTLREISETVWMSQVRVRRKTMALGLLYIFKE